MIEKRKKVITALYDVGALKFGNFTLKSGMQSPHYIDFRIVISHPELFSELLDLAWQRIATVNFDVVTGVPYAALPYATGIALLHKKPLIMVRKEIKDHGIAKKIDGLFNAGDRALIIEDLVTSGSSVLEIIEALEHEKMSIKDIFIFLDRQQGGVTYLEKKGYHVHALFTLSEILTILHAAHRIDQHRVNTVQEWVANHQIV